MFPLYPAAMAAPWLARLAEMAAPMPLVPPVTKATFPLSLSPTTAGVASLFVERTLVVMIAFQVRGKGLSHGWQLVIWTAGVRVSVGPHQRAGLGLHFIQSDVWGEFDKAEVIARDIQNGQIGDNPIYHPFSGQGQVAIGQ